MSAEHASRSFAFVASRLQFLRVLKESGLQVPKTPEESREAINFFRVRLLSVLAQRVSRG